MLVLRVVLETANQDIPPFNAVRGVFVNFVFRKFRKGVYRYDKYR